MSTPLRRPGLTALLLGVVTAAASLVTLAIVLDERREATADRDWRAERRSRGGCLL